MNTPVQGACDHELFLRNGHHIRDGVQVLGPKVDALGAGSYVFQLRARHVVSETVGHFCLVLGSQDRRFVCAGGENVSALRWGLDRGKRTYPTQKFRSNDRRKNQRRLQ